MTRFCDLYALGLHLDKLKNMVVMLRIKQLLQLQCFHSRFAMKKGTNLNDTQNNTSVESLVLWTHRACIIKFISSYFVGNKKLKQRYSNYR